MQESANAKTNLRTKPSCPLLRGSASLGAAPFGPSPFVFLRIFDRRQDGAVFHGLLAGAVLRENDECRPQAREVGDAAIDLLELLDGFHPDRPARRPRPRLEAQ